MALPTFLNYSADLGGSTSGTDLEVDLPSGYGAGTVITVCIERNPGLAAPTPPAGFVLIATQPFGGDGGEYRVYRKPALGTEGASVNFTGVDAGENYPWVAVAYNGAAPTSYQVAGNTSGSGTAMDWTSPSFSALVQQVVVSFILATSGNNVVAPSTLRSGSLAADIVAVDRTTGPGTTAGSTIEFSGAGFGAAVVVGMRPLNSAPYAPALTTLTGGQVVDVAVTNRASHVFSDPDADLPRPEGQSKYEIRYRVVGNPTWTTLTPAPTANQYHDFAGGTFTTGVNYERQVRTYDLAGEVGPWSGSSFFTGGTAPTAPVITDPTLDEDITANSFLVTWTVTTQTSYQVRTVADDNGSPNANTIYYDSGTVASSGARTATVPFLVNNRTEHVQVRVWDGTLWSAWTSVRVDVFFTQPPPPVVTLSVNAALGAIVVNYDTPAPAGGEPTPTYVDIWVDDGGDIGNERKVTGLPVDGEWTYMTPRSGRDYEPHIHAIAYTADGIPSPAVGVLTFLLDSATRGVLDQNVLA